MGGVLVDEGNELQQVVHLAGEGVALAHLVGLLQVARFLQDLEHLLDAEDRRTAVRHPVIGEFSHVGQAPLQRGGVAHRLADLGQPHHVARVELGIAPLRLAQQVEEAHIGHKPVAHRFELLPDASTGVGGGRFVVGHEERPLVVKTRQPISHGRQPLLGLPLAFLRRQCLVLTLKPDVADKLTLSEQLERGFKRVHARPPVRGSRW